MGIRNANESLKVNIMVQAEFSRVFTQLGGVANVEYAKFYYNLKEVINSESDIQGIIAQLTIELPDYNLYGIDATGSGWGFVKFDGFRIAISRYVLRTARGYIELPEQYRNSKKGLVNIRNDDDKCFQYCIIAALHPPNNKKTRIDYYQSKKVQENIVPLYNWNGVKFPTSLKDVRKFEANNKITINVFSLDKEDDTYEIHPHSISK